MDENKRTVRTPEEKKAFNRALIRARRARYTTYKGDIELAATGLSKPSLHYYYRWEEETFCHSRTLQMMSFPKTWQDSGSGLWFGECPTCNGTKIFTGKNAKPDNDSHDQRTACWTCKPEKVSYGFIAIPSPTTLKMFGALWVAQKIRDVGKEEGLCQVLRVAKAEYGHCNKMIRKEGRHELEHSMVEFWRMVGSRAEYLLSDDGAHLSEPFMTTDWTEEFRTGVSMMLSLSKWVSTGLPPWLARCFVKAERARADA